MTRRERQRRQAKRQRYTMLAMLALGLVVGVLVAIMISNNARQRVLAEYARDTIETCEEDGAIDCHSEWVYDGLVLTDFYVSGQTMGAQDE